MIPNHYNRRNSQIRRIKNVISAFSVAAIASLLTAGLVVQAIGISCDPSQLTESRIE